MNIERISIHGGHSGSFCNHAEDTLEEILVAYINAGFKMAGITEHMPAVEEKFMYPDEKEAGMTVKTLHKRFCNYFQECAGLKNKFRDQISILIGFETEMYSGTTDYIHKIIKTYCPDYFVGSLHHVDDMMIDVSDQLYSKAVEESGGLVNLYCRYFDQQFEMIKELEPDVIGHFDLVRFFDSDYPVTLKNPEVNEKIERNLQMIKNLDLILDLNLSGFDKPAKEQYPSIDILKRAVELGIAIAPGDDSHGVSTVGRHFEKGMNILKSIGCRINYRRLLA
ncbi:MAG: histidinol-phosphatase [Chitinispirillia bacterium]|jgi:histidinol-phosphatase (PHP family)